MPQLDEEGREGRIVGLRVENESSKDDCAFVLYIKTPEGLRFTARYEGDENIMGMYSAMGLWHRHELLDLRVGFDLGWEQGECEVTAVYPLERVSHDRPIEVLEAEHEAYLARVEARKRARTSA